MRNKKIHEHSENNRIHGNEQPNSRKAVPDSRLASSSFRSGFFKVATLTTLLISLSACVLVPGSNIDPDIYEADAGSNWFEVNRGTWFPGLRGGDAESDATAGEPLDEDTLEDAIDIVPITSNVIAQQSQSQNLIPAAMPASLQEDIANYEYHVGKGDMLHITVYDHPELTNPSGSNNNNIQNSGIIVESDGTIFYPYIGKVQVAGKTTNEIRESIANPLAEFIASPQVNVRVIGFNAERAYVTGQVANPGPQPINDIPMTVLDAISRAGGLADGANWHEVLLSRNGVETRLSVYEMLNNGRLGQNMLLQHGDVLHVPDLGQQKVFVLGELNRVNTLPMGNIRMSLTEALTRSGGLNQVTSNAEGIFVIRQTEATSDKLATVYQLNVRNAVAFAVGTQFMLEPSDIVYVTTAPVTRWNRVISQIIPSLNALITADRVNQL
ncbi:polysaccharide export protein [Pseudohongiella nitratireducens]|nr:polysaccharide export protein [Pseudohongiella nitratireducens]